MLHYYTKHRDTFLAQRKAEYVANPEPIKAARALYREANRERLRLKAKEAYATNPERREYAKAYAKAYRASNPEKIAQWRVEAAAREPETGVIKARRARARARRPWAILIAGAGHRARNSGLPFDLTPEWAEGRWTGNCELTGIPFVINTTPGPAPYSPSIDRIDPALGYTQANCRFVLMAVNALKGCGTDEDIKRIAQAIIDGHTY